jgi:metal-sulfur cluster biosynthetic enzyme
MKLTMEIQGHYTGFSPHKQRPAEQVAWTSVWGNDSNGRYARAVTYGTVATALNKAINGMLSENEVVSSKRIVVTLNGEWQTRTVVKDGKEEKQRNFVAKETEHAPAFNILDGIALEAARLRNDATQALRSAEKLRNSGQLALAYEAVAQFVANYAGVPLDLETFLADSEADDKEFGSTAHVDADPEALAAAHFAREDRVKETAAPTDTAATEHAPEEATETVDDTPEETADFGAPEERTAEFGADDEVLGPTSAAAESSEDVAEEDAIMIDAAPVDDVLDDSPAEPVRQAPAPQPKGPAFQTATPFANRQPAPQQAASKPFSRPEPVRQAPQPVARPVPSQDELSAPPQASVPSFLAPRVPRF